jgi:hypothetical protein
MNKFPVEITKRERVQIQGERRNFCGASALVLAASDLPSGHQTSSAHGNIIICWVQLLPSNQLCWLDWMLGVGSDWNSAGSEGPLIQIGGRQQRE